ncbi:universal stress protein [Hymenobacter gummosus]|uniref:Universal stress protein n=1 Tax=Hymenobacter gummosus TaxID=1776032 RepID=A0A3S0HIT8_9BACT|nr:universal stress protein [Hymenobacter gummosus]RTQ44861.1 universal stress protein [Hymenobacter gummosus]
MTTFNVLMDCSPAADDALRYAVQLVQHLLSRHLPAQLRLLAVLPASHDEAAPYFTALAGWTPRQAAGYLQRQLQALPPALRTDPEVVTGAVAAELALRLRPNGADILVLGRSTGTAAPLHHPSLYLCRLLPQPLLLVPAAASAAAPPTRVVLDTDGLPVHLSRTAHHVADLLLSLCHDSRVLYLSPGRPAVRQLIQQLLPKAAGIHVYTADEPVPQPAEVLERLTEIGLLAGLPHTLHTAYHESVEQGIIELVQAHAADLLVFVARQFSLPEADFYQSPGAGLMQRSPVPTLVVPEAAPVPWTRCV